LAALFTRHHDARALPDAGAGDLDVAVGEHPGLHTDDLATVDQKLPTPVADLIPRSAVVGYPTNFGAMSEEDIYLLTTRGEQLVRLLLPSYCPSLVG